MVDFIVEFTYAEMAKLAGTANAAEATKMVEMTKNEASIETSEMSDDALCRNPSNEGMVGARIMLVSPEEHKIQPCSLG